MFIIWGFGHRIVKSFGTLTNQLCDNCNNKMNRELLKVTTWITIFFIPVIPYRKEFLLVCPICKNALKISKIDFESLIEGNSVPAQNVNILGRLSNVKTSAEKNKYAGKTETQIAYLQQMEEFENSRKAQ